MHDVTYGIDDLKDLFVQYPLKFNEALTSMREYSAKGHPIIIEQAYNNAPSDLVARLLTLDDVDAWIKKTFPGLSQGEEE